LASATPVIVVTEAVARDDGDVAAWDVAKCARCMSAFVRAVSGFAPPLLVTVVSGVTRAVGEVAADFAVVLVVFVELAGAVVPVDADPTPVVASEVVVPFLGGDVAALLAGALTDVAELDEDDVPPDAPVVSAAATPWPVATAVASHAATAIPP
jgi:hypothetical protein